jgi:hypothetical protein
MDVAKAFKRFTAVYQTACQQTEEISGMLMPDTSVELALATRGDIHAASSWRGSLDFKGVERQPPNGGWEWPVLFDGQRKDTKSYCVAIRTEGELGGLLLGGVSKGKNIVSIRYLEAAISQTPLSSNIVDIAVNFSTFVAIHSEVNASFVGVYEPNERMRARLMEPQMGFVEENLFGYRMKNDSSMPLFKDLRSLTVID